MKTILNVSRTGIVLILIMVLGTFSAKASSTVCDMLNDGNYLWISYYQYSGYPDSGNYRLVKYDKTTGDSIGYSLLGDIGYFTGRLAKDVQDNIWVTTGYPSLAKFNGASVEYLNLVDYGLPDYINQNIYIDKSNNMWLGLVGYSYLVKYDGITWQKWNINPFNADVAGVSNMYMDKNGVLWVAGSVMLTNGWSFGYFDGTKIVNLLSPWESINAMTVDKNGVFWLATRLDGLIKYDGTTFTYFTTQNSNIPHDQFTDVEVDATGNIWLTFGSELVKFDGINNFKSYSVPSTENRITSLEADINGDMWIGTQTDYTAEPSVKGKVYRYSAKDDVIVSTGLSGTNTGIDGVEADNGINVYTNSVSGCIYIDLKDKSIVPTEVKAYDLSGRLLGIHSITGASIDLKSLNIRQSGYYILEVNTNKGMFRRKMLVNH